MSVKSLELEAMTIGCLLKGGLTTQARGVLDWLKPEMFAVFKLGEMFSAIRKQAAKDNLIDLMLLSTDYNISLADLAEVSKVVASSANLTGYAEKVRQLYQRRTASKIFLEVAGELNTARDEQLDEITANGLQTLSRLLSNTGKIEPVAMGDLLEGYLEVFKERSNPANKNHRLYTDITALDEMLGGIEDTDICIVAGRPGAGKTETAITLTRNILARGESVLFFSLEMSREQIVERLIAASSGVSSSLLRNPLRMDDEHFAKMGEALDRLQAQSLYIVDKGGLSMDQILAIASEHLEQVGKPAVLVIDYIGLVSHGTLDGRVNRTYQIAESMNKLKAWLKDNRIPTVLLSQLNRNADDTRPTLGELRDSGSLEQDASQVILVHNARNKKDNEPNRYTEWIIAKNRHGRMGTVYMEFKYGQFWECDQAMAWESFQKPANTKSGKQYGQGEA